MSRTVTAAAVACILLSAAQGAAADERRTALPGWGGAAWGMRPQEVAHAVGRTYGAQGRLFHDFQMGPYEMRAQFVFDAAGLVRVHIGPSVEQARAARASADCAALRRHLLGALTSTYGLPDGRGDFGRHQTGLTVFGFRDGARIGVSPDNTIATGGGCGAFALFERGGARSAGM